MAKARRQQDKHGMPGRPAAIRGRDIVVTLIVSAEARQALSDAAAATDMSLGDVIETLIGTHGARVKLPPAIASNARWAPKRYTDRTDKVRVRLSSQALDALDAIGKTHTAVRSDVIEALIRQHAAKVKAPKR